MEVFFLPKSAGSKTATLRIASSPPDSATLDVALNGTGVVCTKLTLLAPNQGDVIRSGSTYKITWWAPPEIAKFNLKHSRDNGVTWVPIASGVKGSSHDWPVPKASGNKRQCYVKVIGYDVSGQKAGADISDKPFTVEVLRVTSPNGKEMLRSQTTTTLTWTTHLTKAPVKGVKLYYTTNGGGKWSLIPANIKGNPGRYDWTVPTVREQKTRCQVKVVLKDTEGNTLGSDVSDAFFIIQP